MNTDTQKYMVEYSDGATSVQFYSEQPEIFAVFFSFASSINAGDVIVQVDGEPVETLNKENGIHAIIQFDTPGLHLVSLHNLRKDVRLQNITLSAVLGKAYPFASQASDLRFPPENQIVVFGKSAVIRYTNGPVFSASLWVVDPGNYMLSFETLRLAPPPIEIQVLLDDKLIGEVDLEQGDGNWEEISLPLTISEPGLHSISFIFMNDSAGSEGDRNAIISEINVKHQP